MTDRENLADPTRGMPLGPDDPLLVPGALQQYGKIADAAYGQGRGRRVAARIAAVFLLLIVVVVAVAGLVSAVMR